MEKTFRENFALDKPIFGSGARKSQNPTPSQKIPKVWQNLEELEIEQMSDQPLVK
jgi:hypothetical protein